MSLCRLTPMSRYRPKRPPDIIRRSNRSLKTSLIRLGGRSINNERGSEPWSMRDETAAAFSLLSAEAVRSRAHRMLALGLDDGLPNFRVELSRLDAAADLVIAVMREAYPSLAIPF